MAVKSSSLSLIIALTCVLTSTVSAQKIDYSVVNVPEESGLEFVKITKPSDYVAMPPVIRKSHSAQWLTNKILGISSDGNQLAYLSLRNGATNIFLKDLDKQGSAVQRTNRTAIQDFSFSPDGKYILFSEIRGKNNRQNINEIFRTDAKNGYICRQITSGDCDYSPVYSPDMKQIYFTRMEQRGSSIWAHDVDKNFLASYVSGMNPSVAPNDNSLIISRVNNEGRGEIWKVNPATGAEECIVADPVHSFTTPEVSPDGQWILFVGDGRIPTGKGNSEYVNTDIFACKIDGTQMTQLTYHAADDLSPVWSKDGKHIYFISQRGDAEATPNVWRMNFNH
ncbi:MAG: hypothetical protein K2M94_02030 [Paramuribaculum sp.]|nr:hypothetical protein [Paramuribaculum sp.]